LYTFSFLVRYF